VRNRIERWMQELKRRIDAFYASFTGDDVVTTNNWLRQLFVVTASSPVNEA
jgi:transposase-like protein